MNKKIMLINGKNRIVTVDNSSCYTKLIKNGWMKLGTHTYFNLGNHACACGLRLCRSVMYTLEWEKLVTLATSIIKAPDYSPAKWADTLFSLFFCGNSLLGIRPHYGGRDTRTQDAVEKRLDEMNFSKGGSIFEVERLYTKDGLEPEGWCIWERSTHNLPTFDTLEEAKAWVLAHNAPKDGERWSVQEWTLTKYGIRSYSMSNKGDSTQVLLNNQSRRYTAVEVGEML